MTTRQFDEQFPDDNSCLDHIFRVRFGEIFNCPKCDKEARYYRVKKRRCYECEHCGNQIFPTVGTPFEKSRTGLKTWFYVMFLFCASRNGVAAKEVQRQTGVTYKTAWRMCNLIRQYMGYVDGDGALGGPGMPPVEVDKAFIGGKDKQGFDDKAVVVGMQERKGDVITRAVPTKHGRHVIPAITSAVRPGGRIMSDEAPVFGILSAHGYKLEQVNHRKKEWVRGSVHTNTIEAYWSNLKRGIKGTYVWVSKKHLQTYLWEFEFRHNLRKAPHLMFDALLLAFPRVCTIEQPANIDSQTTSESA